MIEVYYGHYDETWLTLTAKKYMDKLDIVADGPNDNNGKVYKEFKGEPYNYFSEIKDAMEEIGCSEQFEAVFDMCDLTLDEIINGMAERGFKLVHNDELDLEQ